MKLTIYDIAKKAQVSIATVSRALNKETREKVSELTLKKIDDIIEKYQYRPRLAAQQLTKTKFYTIGVLLPHVPNLFMEDYYMKLLAGVSDALLETDYQFKLILLKDYDNKKQLDQYDFQYIDNIDGLVISHWEAFFSSYKILEKFQFPYVNINDYEPRLKTISVCADNESGGELAAEHLINLGHESIFLIRDEMFSKDNRRRSKGFIKYWEKYGGRIFPKKWIISDKIIGQEVQLAKKFKKEKITAVFCLNDYISDKLLNVLPRIGLSCPVDLSVVGFDDQYWTSLCKPSLTTVRQDIYQMSKKGVELLLSRLSGKDIQKEKEIFPVHLVQRESTRHI